MRPGRQLLLPPRIRIAFLTGGPRPTAAPSFSSAHVTSRRLPGLRPRPSRFSAWWPYTTSAWLGLPPSRPPCPTHGPAGPFASPFGRREPSASERQRLDRRGVAGNDASGVHRLRVPQGSRPVGGPRQKPAARVGGPARVPCPAPGPDGPRARSSQESDCQKRPGHLRLRDCRVVRVCPARPRTRFPRAARVRTSGFRMKRISGTTFYPTAFCPARCRAVDGTSKPSAQRTTARSGLTAARSRVACLRGQHALAPGVRVPA